MNNHISQWNNSYKNKDNFVFYPHEEIIRFISKYIKKRIGFNDFKKQYNFHHLPKVLDFGCGIGRHVKLINEFKLDAYGFDLSTDAISYAKEIFQQQNLSYLGNKVIQANITNLPYDDNKFDFMLSHGVLDSMPFEIAKIGMSELHRCIQNDGYIYFDLISTKDSSFNGNLEKEIDEAHELGTIQSYFDLHKINLLLGKLFQIQEITLIEKQDILNNINHARYHVVVKKLR
ncbi:methyltransferase domain-containing protein [Sulfurimonas aquatica]|uniref:Methyltransferase domain-containing protein n=1 Tax=Sulfurimonas aquatica TaxID=2672570 RepID=A0A975AY45_9BACT|nr:class I SAM-dependent methyltransferase [Sulfurimonas aquatica]QSZ40742.1 methyltransferase domain-containing protein [Sulfurimonas aquatica]